MDLSNTDDKKFRNHEILTTENFGPVKYTREKILDPRKTHEKTFGFKKERWHNAAIPTSLAIAPDPRNLEHSLKVVRQR